MYGVSLGNDLKEKGNKDYGETYQPRMRTEQRQQQLPVHLSCQEPSAAPCSTKLLITLKRGTDKDFTLLKWYTLRLESFMIHFLYLYIFFLFDQLHNLI